ncbi:MAG: arginine--tRNA ligase [Candidatus Marinimicrobia bacterium]|nr:arginine--tRNA ligase [Candidatus Neomarinimicrobiota bacterium]
MLQTIQKMLTDTLAGLGWEPVPFMVERSRKSNFGHVSSNIALALAKNQKRRPQDIAEELKAALEGKIGGVEKIEILSPGFMNFFFLPAYFQEFIPRIRAQKADFQREGTGRGKKVQVEFVSANPTGPLTIGHGRQAVLGDAIARIFEWHGYDVTREYYFNDAGRQMRMLGLSVYARYRELLGETLEIPEGGYEGEYISEIAQHYMERYGKGRSEKDLDTFIDHASKEIFITIQDSLKRLGIVHDVYYNEKDLYSSGKIDSVLAELKEKGYTYEEGGAVWFKASEFGAEKDRVLVKNTGEPTYRLPDIAYHREKILRGFDLIVDIFGADHHATYPDVKAALSALGYDTSSIRVLLHQFVTLTQDGEKVKMSTRKANFVTLDELIDIAGPDVVRYFYIMRNMDSHLNFDIALAQKQTDENPVFYLQYAHARMCNILVHSSEKHIDSYEDADLSLLSEPEIIELIGIMAEFRDVMDLCLTSLEPMYMTNYLYRLATAFHKFYSVHRVVTEDIALSKARLQLIEAVKIILANGLRILGISAPEKM